MSFFSGKILLIFVLVLAILAIGSYIYLSNRPTLFPLPIQKMDQTSPSSNPVATPLSSPSTIPFDQATDQQKKELQNQSDEYYQKTQDAILKKYPWYNSYSIKDTNYFVYFDVSSETFKATLYPQKASSVSIDNQVNSMKSSIVQKINALGSDTGKYNIIWEVIPE